VIELLICQNGHIFKAKWYDWISPFSIECHAIGCRAPLRYVEKSLDSQKENSGVDKQELKEY